MSNKIYHSTFHPASTLTGVKGTAAFIPGYKNAIVYLYRRSASALTSGDKPDGDVIYTFGTGSTDVSAVTNSWTATIPAGTDPLYVVVATALGSGTTDTILTAEWTDPVIFVQDGTAFNSNTILLFKRSNDGDTPPAVPSGTLTYTFSTNGLAGDLESWTQSIPDSSAGQYLYVTFATAYSSSATDDILTGEWSAPVIMSADSLNSYLVPIYKRAASLPSVPTGTLTYTFSTGVLSGTLEGWTQAVPATDGNPLYIAHALAISTEDTYDIDTGEWSTPIIVLQDGTDGTDGADGADAVAIFLAPNKPTFHYDSSGTIDTQTTIIYIKRSNIPTSQTNVYLYKVKDDGTETAIGGVNTPTYLTNTTYIGDPNSARTTSNSMNITHTSFNSLMTSGVIGIRIYIEVNGYTSYNADAFIYKVSDGQDASNLNYYLDPPALYVPVDESTENFDTTGLASTFIIKDAAGNDISSNFSLSTLSNNLGENFSINYSGMAINTIAGFDVGEDPGKITIRATGSGTYSGVYLERVLYLYNDYNVIVKSTNDRNIQTPDAPAFDTGYGTSGYNVTRNFSSGNVSVAARFTFTPAAANNPTHKNHIDGFEIGVYSSDSATAPSAGTFETDADWRLLDSLDLSDGSLITKTVNFVIDGAANKYYQFGVRAVRKVHTDVEPTGFIKSAITRLTGTYRPSANQNFTGTIDSVDATIVSGAATDFNSSNNQNTTPIADPDFSGVTTRLDYDKNSDGSCDITFNWAWTDANNDPEQIDGFLVYTYVATADEGKGATDVSGNLATTSQDFKFGAGGYKLFVGNGTYIHEFSLESPYRVETINYTQNKYLTSLVGALNSTHGIYFRYDGQKAYVLSNAASDIIYQFSLSTPWDISTLTYDSKSFTIGTILTTPGAIAFRSDGKRVYVAGGSKIYEIPLGTAWDISTATFTGSANIDKSAELTNIAGMSFNFDGSKLLVVDQNDIHEYSLDTDWSLADTVTLVDDSTLIAGIGTPVGLDINFDGDMIAIMDSDDEIYNYEISNTTVEMDLTYLVEPPLGDGTPGSAYTFGTSASRETIYAVPTDITSFRLSGVPLDNYYTFGVRAYRRVHPTITQDDDTNPVVNGSIVSGIVKSTTSGHDPYRPGRTASITGTIGYAGPAYVLGDLVDSSSPFLDPSKILNSGYAEQGGDWSTGGNNTIGVTLMGSAIQVLSGTVMIHFIAPISVSFVDPTKDQRGQFNLSLFALDSHGNYYYSSSRTMEFHWTADTITGTFKTPFRLVSMESIIEDLPPGYYRFGYYVDSTVSYGTAYEVADIYFYRYRYIRGQDMRSISA